MTNPFILPTFRYHPDPIASGVVKKSSVLCVVCNLRRGYVYTGPVHAVGEYRGKICPWCIDNGTAHEKLKAHFTGIDGIGKGWDWDSVSQEVTDEISYRTPGFGGWQEERWWTHCHDAAEFLGPAGYPELSTKWSEVIPFLRTDARCDTMPAAEWDALIRKFDICGRVTAYVFRCRHCGKLGGYWDCD